MNGNNRLLTLEDLPNEIFLNELLPLFSLRELYYSFVGLNRKFDKLLQAIGHLDFMIKSSTGDDPALSFFIPCIARLKVCIGQYDIASFSALRSLTLQYPSLQQRNAIRPSNFPYLEYLNLSYPIEDRVLLNLIFSGDFKNLKKCKFDTTRTDHLWERSPNIRSLSIIVHDSYGIVCVLRACPNLHWLNIIVLDTPQTDLSLPNYPISCTNELLTHLFIRSTFEILISILKIMPELKWFCFDDIESSRLIAKPPSVLKVLADVLFMLKKLSYICIKISIKFWHMNKQLHTVHPLFKYYEIEESPGITVISSSVI